MKVHHLRPDHRGVRAVAAQHGGVAIVLPHKHEGKLRVHRAVTATQPVADEIRCGEGTSAQRGGRKIVQSGLDGLRQLLGQPLANRRLEWPGKRLTDRAFAPAAGTAVRVGRAEENLFAPQVATSLQPAHRQRRDFARDDQRIRRDDDAGLAAHGKRDGLGPKFIVNSFGGTALSRPITGEREGAKFTRFRLVNRRSNRWRESRPSEASAQWSRRN
jgi:hypothetical protein